MSRVVDVVEVCVGAGVVGAIVVVVVTTGTVYE